MTRLSRHMVVVVAVLSCLQAAASSQTLSLAGEPGWDIFVPSNRDTYRYGPSIILNADGSMDMWLSSTPVGRPSPGSHWDYITYRHSDDGGRTWTPDRYVLKPTDGSRDQISVCDPGVVKFGGYYYLGVTSVENPDGKCNEIFVSRARKPEGPYEKWNGQGWGGDKPMPLIAFRDPARPWGLGEPSFVVRDDTVYIYYTCAEVTGHKVLVATAPTDDPNWPARIVSRGTAFLRTQHGQDSVDVKYVPAINQFIAVSTGSRFTDDAHIILQTSDDGLRFGPPVRQNLPNMPKCHNAGISGNASGHFDVNMPNVIGYAYTKGETARWGFWHAYLQPVTLDVVKEADTTSKP